MNTNGKSYYDIYDGPSKDRIFDACKYVYDKDWIKLRFSIALSYDGSINDPDREAFKMYASDFKITSIEYEDGSGNRLILNGYCSADLNDGRDIYDRLDYMDYDVRAFNHSHCSSDKEYDGKELLKKYTFSMFYDAEKRKGNISFSG